MNDSGLTVSLDGPINNSGLSSFSKMLSNASTASSTSAAAAAASAAAISAYASTSPYLNPDYVQPLCTSLDAKNSPLALLAQTCSSIGRDSATTSKSTGGADSKKDNAGSSSSHHRELHPSTNNHGGRSGTLSPGSHRSSTASGTTTKKTSSSSSSVGGGGGSTSSSRLHDSQSTSPMQPTRVGLSSTSRRTPVPTSRKSDDSSFSPNDRLSTGSGSSSDRRLAPLCPVPVQPSSVDGLRYGTDHQDHNNSDNNNISAAAEACLKSPLSAGFPSPAVVALQQHLSGTLRLQQEAAAFQAAALAAAAYNPLLYPPPPTPGSAAGLDPLSVYSAGLQAAAAALYPRLKDPLCAPDQCSIPGCTQCRVNGGRDPLRPPPFQPSLYPGLFGGSASSIFPSLAASCRPAPVPTGAGSYACSWLLQGGEFCGKRFQSTDELHQHLRSHVVEAAAGGASDFGPYMSGLPPSLQSVFGGFTVPNSSSAGSVGFSPASFFDAARLSSLGVQFPRSLSPSTLLAFHHQQQQQQQQQSQSRNGCVSPSLLRYHPYKSVAHHQMSSPSAAAAAGSFGGPGSGLPMTPSQSALAAYFSSPYALFGAQQMGAAAGP